ncbi:MAG: sigma 54-interacting transcriptional regulator [Planctomycetes bacterium]|nr:sigma 54-interacting transcriptional regulator [Planctomycetota bacterium]
MKPQKQLSDFLVLMKSVLAKGKYVQAARMGEPVLKSLSSFSGSSVNKYLLYYFLSSAYFYLEKYSQALDVLNKASLISKNLSSSHQVLASNMLGRVFMGIRNTRQAFGHYQKVYRYYKEYGTKNDPLSEKQYFITLTGLAYCYLYTNELEKAGGIIEKELPDILPSMFSGNSIGMLDYYHLKGEYLIARKDYADARKSFLECVKIGEQCSFFRGVLEARTHLAIIDILEGRLDSAIQLLRNLFREASRLKLRSLVCESGLLLSKSFHLKGYPEKAEMIEKRIKPILDKLDTIWLYEKIREFNKIHRQLQTTDFSRQSFKPDRILLSVPIPDSLSDVFRKRSENASYKEIIIGNSLVMHDTWNLIEKIAPTDLPVLIQGETGTGKELVANIIHHRSLRAKTTWLAFNSGTTPEPLIETTLFGHTRGAFTGAEKERKGYIELADNGTLFIDEIANMSQAMQQKLLRVLEEKLIWRVGDQKSIPVDTRFVFASNQDIEKMVQQKLFREDLFYRINTIVITLPPLRDRKDDIPLLIQHFLQKHGRFSSHLLPVTSRFSPSAFALLASYAWPGNVRELENEMKRISVLYSQAKIITEEMLSATIRSYIPSFSLADSHAAGLKELRDSFERNIITETLQRCNNNVAEASRLLKYDRASLYKKAKSLKIRFPG